jgi:hypothetical protein
MDSQPAPTSQQMATQPAHPRTCSLSQLRAFSGLCFLEGKCRHVACNKAGRHVGEAGKGISSRRVCWCAAGAVDGVLLGPDLVKILDTLQPQEKEPEVLLAVIKQ